MTTRQYSLLDKALIDIELGLRTVFGRVSSGRPNPSAGIDEPALTQDEQKQSEGFVRVDHTGEVCAQALYRGQMMVSRSKQTYEMLENACEEEVDHLSWTHERLDELKGHRSYLNAYWYVHSFLIGVIAGLAGDRWSLGFVEETEKQVSQHLTDHIERLPEADQKSLKIAEQMREDEERHGKSASDAGGTTLPFTIKKLMALQSKVMTTLAYYF